MYNLGVRVEEVDGDDGRLHRYGDRIQNVQGDSDGDNDRAHHHCGHSNQDVEIDNDGDAPRRCDRCVLIVVAHSDGDDLHRCDHHDISVDENAGYHRLDGDDEFLECDGDECLYSANIEH